MIRDLKADQYYAKKYTPEEIEVMKGIADGATAAGYKTSYTDVLLLNARKPGMKVSPATYPRGAEDEILEECSIWSVWGSTTTDGGYLAANGMDLPFRPSVIIVAFPEHGNSYITAASAGQLGRHFNVNNKGTFIGISDGGAQREIDFSYGVPFSLWLPHLLRFADSASEAKDMYLALKGPYCLNIHFSDVHGNAFVVETTAELKAVRKPGDFGEIDFIYSTNNYFMEKMKEAGKSKKFIEHGGWLGDRHGVSSIPRNLFLWNVLHNYQGKIDVDIAKMMWRFPDKDGVKIGWLWNRAVSVIMPDDGDKGVIYICTGPAGYPLRPERGNYQIAGTHSFYQLTLASSPTAVVEAANQKALDYIGEAYRELTRLNYTDTGYAALTEIYSQANAEYFEGLNAYNKGFLASGNEAPFYFGKAATAFTRAQAHAKQVYNALVPPATRPEDLGLKPYGGSWAEWVTDGSK